MRLIRKQFVLMLALSVMPFAICSSQEKSDPDLQIVEQRLKNLRPDLPITDIYNSPVSGLLLLIWRRNYSLRDSRRRIHVCWRSLFLREGFSNETDKRRDKARREILSKEPLEDMIIFSPSKEVKTFVNIFTDVDCGYCQKLHSQIASYNALGIEIRYMAYPRAGLEGDTFDKTVSAWCANDRRGAITTLKKGQGYHKSCDNPVEAHYLIGQQIGIKEPCNHYLLRRNVTGTCLLNDWQLNWAYNTSFSSTLIVQKRV